MNRIREWIEDVFDRLLWWVEELSVRAAPYAFPTFAVVMLLSGIITCARSMKRGEACTETCKPASAEVIRGRCLCETEDGYRWAQ